MTALFHNRTTFHHHNIVRILNGTEAVCDRDGGTTVRRAIQCILDNALTCSIKGTGCLIQEQDARIFYHRTSDRDALLLPTTQKSSSFTDLRLIALRKLRDKSVCIRQMGRVHNQLVLLLLGIIIILGMQQAKSNVFPHGCGKKGRFLRHKANLRTQPSDI